MNSHFNYELDERQIRLLLLDAEMAYSELDWEAYEVNTKGQTKSTLNLLSYVPNVNLGISRSIVLPIVFIVCIGSLSALLFSFIDFKKKSNEVKEELLIVATPSVSVTKVTPVKKIDTITLAVVTPPIITKTVVTQENIGTKKTDINPEPKEDKKITTDTSKESKPEDTLEKKADSLVSLKDIKEKKPVAEKKKKKKRKRTIRAEDLPSINTTNNLSAPSVEPELKIE